MDETSHCGCLLPEGFWGSDGWHFKRYTRGDLVTLMKRRFKEERPRHSNTDLAREWGVYWKREMEQGYVKDGVHVSMSTYLGLPVAVERCERYMALYRSKIDQGRIARQAGELLA